MSQRSGKKPTSLFRQIYEIPYNDSQKIKLYNSAQGSLDMVQRLAIHKKLPIHNGCVNCICWSENGEYLLSGSDDHHLVVTNAMKDFKTEIRYQTNHRANIFNAKFLPHRSHTSVISCSGDGLITFSDLNIPVLPSQLSSDLNCFSCHSGTVYELATIPHDPNTFLSAGEDDTVRCFDLRVKSSCHKVMCKDDILIQCERAVTAISVNEAAPYQLAIGTADSTVRIFDRRMMGTIADGYSARNTRPIVLCSAPGMDNRAYRITSVAFSPDGHEVLASYSSEYLYLFNIRQTCSTPMQYSQDSNSTEEREGRRVKEKSCPVRRLRLRGDWSDTGPNARPEREGEPSNANANVHLTVMQRMTDLLTRILNDPMTRAAIASGDRDQEPQDQEPNISEALSEAHDTRIEANIDVEDTMDTEPTPNSISFSNPTTLDDALNLNTSELAGLNSTDHDTMDTEYFSNSIEPTPNTSNSITSEDVPKSISELPASNSTDHDTMDTEHVSNSIEPASNTSFNASNTSDATTSTRDDGPNTSSFASNDSNLTPNASNSTDHPLSFSEPLAPSSSRVVLSEYDMDLDQSSDDETRRMEQDLVESANNTRRKMAKKHRGTGFCDDYATLGTMKRKFTGHRNARTMIKQARFWGSQFVMSGSDCGHLFIWDRYTGALANCLEADHHVVNCVLPHPSLPLLATSGIDYDVKIWEPNLEEPSFDMNRAQELIKRNEIMLEETKDTITVPASFMIRMLACLNQIRRGGALNRAGGNRNPPENNEQ